MNADDTTTAVKVPEVKKTKRDAKRAGGFRKKANDKFKIDQQVKHATTDVEGMLAKLTIGRSHPDRLVPINLMQLTWLVWLCFDKYMNHLSSRARSCQISASQVLRCVICAVHVKMSLIHFKVRPQFGYVTLPQDLINRALGSCGFMPKPLAGWFQNMGFFNVGLNRHVPVADHSTMGFFSEDGSGLNWTVLFALLREHGAWIDATVEKNFYARVQNHMTREVSLPDCAGTYVSMDVEVAPPAPEPSYNPRSPEPTTSKRPRSDPPAPRPVRSIRPSSPPIDPLGWFPSPADWGNFKIWCDNWFNDGCPCDLTALDGSAAQLVTSWGSTKPGEVRHYLSGYEITDVLFDIGATMGYGSMSTNHPPNRDYVVRQSDVHDCAMYATVMPLTMMNAII